MLTICFGWALSFLSFLWLEPSNFVGFEACHSSGYGTGISRWQRAAHVLCGPLGKTKTAVSWCNILEDTGEGVLSWFKLEQTLFFNKTFSSTCGFFSLFLSCRIHILFGELPLTIHLPSICQWQMSTLLCIWHICVNKLLSLVEHRVNRCNCLTPGQVPTLLRTCRHVTVDVGFRSKHFSQFVSHFSIFVFSSSSDRRGNLCWWRSVASCPRQRNCMNLWHHVVILHLCWFLSTLCWVPTCAKSQLRLATEAVSWQQIDRLFLQDQKEVLLVWTCHEILTLHIFALRPWVTLYMPSMPFLVLSKGWQRRVSFFPRTGSSFRPATCKLIVHPAWCCRATFVESAGCGLG